MYRKHYIVYFPERTLVRLMKMKQVRSIVMVLFFFASVFSGNAIVALPDTEWVTIGTNYYDNSTYVFADYGIQAQYIGTCTKVCKDLGRSATPSCAGWENSETYCRRTLSSEGQIASASSSCTETGFIGVISHDYCCCGAVAAKGCTDSDGGKDYFTVGSTVSCSGNSDQNSACSISIDYCDGDILIENHCEGGYIKSEKHECEGGCSFGYCLSGQSCLVDASGCGQSDFPLCGTVGYEEVWNGSMFTKQKVCKVQETSTTESAWSFVNQGCAVVSTCDSGCTGGFCSTSQVFSYTIQTDKQEYNDGESVKITGSIVGNDAGDAKVDSWIITPQGNKQEIVLRKIGCKKEKNRCAVDTDSCPSAIRCIYSGDYVIGQRYEEDTILLSEDQLQAAMAETVSSSEEKIDREISKRGNIYYAYSIATLQGDTKISKARFIVVGEKKSKVELMLPGETAVEETVKIEAANNGIESIYFLKCNLPYTIEKSTGKGFVRIEPSPCVAYESCYEDSLEKVLPEHKKLLGEWIPVDYDEDCNKITPEPGVYRASFKYRTVAGTWESVSQEFVLAVKCEKECRHVGTKSEGWYDSCTGELIRFTICKEDSSCNGCTIGDNCLPYGIRTTSGKEDVYCGISSKLESQKPNDASCQNDYECMTNSCATGKCADIAGDIRETKGLLQKALSWLERLFK
ncbi:MAG: hypothetical protein HGA85_00310 [Nanoarchaeota archaeon]|nr:hypothetical protein [Nanoarchaeota archaeon]